LSAPFRLRVSTMVEGSSFHCIFFTYAMSMGGFPDSWNRVWLSLYHFSV